jgi:SAM-dependent methyltransferase
MKYHPNPALRLLRRFFRSFEYNGFRGAVAHSYRRLLRSLKSHGFRGTLERAFVKAPAEPQTALAQEPHPFDLLHGTETGGRISSADLNAVSLSALFATGYLGVPPSALRPALAALPIRHEDFTFVDIGSGKGRALFVAAEFPFRRLIGVEIAGKLCEAARANVALKPEWRDRISIVNEDATRFVYPEGPLVLFLYYPFYAAILRRVLANLEREFSHSTRPIYLLYGNGFDTNDFESFAEIHQFRKVMKSFLFLHEVSEKVYPVSPEDVIPECPFKVVCCSLYCAGSAR